NGGLGFENSSILYYNRNNEGLIALMEMKSHWDNNDSTWHYDEKDFKINLYYDTIRIDTTTSILPINISNIINIYPNPAQNIIQIQSEKENITSAYLIDNTGRTLKQYNTAQNTKSIALDISQYPSGIYTVMLVVDGKKISKKISIQK